MILINTSFKTMTSNNVEEKISIFRNNVLNSNLIDRAGGVLPILGNQIGEIAINSNNKTALVEIKQCAEPQIIAYYEGHLLCKDIKYEILTTEINGAVFILKGKNNKQDGYELQFNNNRSGIIINCSQIELIDFKKVNLSMSDYKDIYTGLLWGKYFSISKDGNKL